MRQPTLFLMVGLPATGKTTAARRLEADHRALRLTKDEWMKALYGEQSAPRCARQQQAAVLVWRCTTSRSPQSSSGDASISG